MAQAAVPDYVGSDFQDCPPGHRFTLYGSFWEPANGWRRMTNIDARALKGDFDKIAGCALDQGAALRKRQQVLAANLATSVEAIFARSTAPLLTGSGIEHPLENGMAFLNPYGLPYLPGASVKGVLRRAAQELAGVIDGIRWNLATDWNAAAIEQLFGREPARGDDDASRGALTFWDVIPECNGLQVDIMNPHHGTYYRGEGSPHDSENPIPIYFLTVPENSGFTFFVQCDDRRLGDSALEWRELLNEAFRHAFTWLGFGAKTAVGYGAMQEDEHARARREEDRLREQAAKEEQLRMASLSPIDREIAETLKEKVDEGMRDSVFLVQQLEAGRWTGPGGRAVAEKVREMMQTDKTWKETSKKPAKDKDYKRTQVVAKFLGGSTA